jgi:hypothetical protein
VWAKLVVSPLQPQWNAGKPAESIPRSAWWHHRRQVHAQLDPFALSRPGNRAKMRGRGGDPDAERLARVAVGFLPLPSSS